MPPPDPADRPTKKIDADPGMLGSPYGPQPRGDDESAGGADSSPHEAEATDEREEASKEARRDPNSRTVDQ